MSSYAVPVLESPTPVPAGEVLLIASGDLRQSANKVSWAAQSEVEKQLTEALRAEGFRQWPIMHALLHGVTRDQFMARHRANHLNVAYAPTTQIADQAMAAKAAMMAELGILVHLCGD
jgi:hypothetical protein